MSQWGFLLVGGVLENCRDGHASQLADLIPDQSQLLHPLLPHGLAHQAHHFIQVLLYNKGLNINFTVELSDRYGRYRTYWQVR